MSRKIRVALVGVGNCSSFLVQSIEYYRNRKEREIPGIMHVVLGGYRIDDIEFVAAFDVDKRKVGKDLSKAIFQEPNNAVKLADVPKLGVTVEKGPVLDGIGEYLRKFVAVDSNQKPANVGDILKESKAQVVVNYLPVGSYDASRYYAQEALNAGCGFINAIPEFLASGDFAKKFEERKLPILGDDIKGQLGASILSRTLARLFKDRGTALDRMYQLNFGGNSVTGDQNILLKVDGITKKVKIGEFIDELMNKYPIELKGDKEVLNTSHLPYIIECFTVDENFKTTTSRVDALIRHKIKEALFEITLVGGAKIKITGDHNLFVLDDEGHLKNIPVHAIKVRDTCIAIPASLPNENKGTSKIKLRTSKTPYKLKGVDSNGFLIFNRNSSTKVPSELPLTEELLKVVGLWLADGNYSRSKGDIEIACGNDEECMEVIDKFANQFNVNYGVRRNGIAVRIFSKPLATVFKNDLGLYGNCYNKQFPGWAFSLPAKQLGYLLSGYISGDGSVIGKQVRWTSASPILVDDVITLLLHLGVYATKFSERNGGYGFGKQTGYVHHGIITSKKELEKFVKKVGFIQSHKNDRVKKVIRRIKEEKVDIPRIKLFDKFGIKPNGKLHSTIGKRIILSQLDKVKDADVKKRILRICGGDLKFVRVKRVRKLPIKERNVYDISTKPYERYICSNVLVHNTDFVNLLEESRLKYKRISKTETVQSVLEEKRLDEYNIKIGPSDYVPWLGTRKIAQMRFEGRSFGDIPVYLDVKLDVDDKSVSAGIMVDAIRCCRLALDRKIGGALISPSAYFFKVPPVQYPDYVAKQMLEEFIEGKRER
ncbi:MAG: LAGLIDADG family homing endonuclease [Candidatus Micrarchaeia archaeon]